jgi:epsilon-lactone hydrolase
MSSPEMTAILELGRAHPRPDEERVEDRRASAEALLRGPLAEGTVASEAMLGGRPALWIHREGTNLATDRVVLYLHGGAFEALSPRDYQSFCSSLAVLLDAAVVVPDYRLAPEHPFPAAVEDVVAAYRGLLDAGHPAQSVALIGDSAGGGLALSCLIDAGRHGLAQPAAAVAISAWADLTLESDAHRRCATTDPFISTQMLRRAAAHYLAGADATDPLASPAHATSEDLGSLAPILLQAAANEVLAHDSVAVAQRIAAAGGDVTLELCPEAFHAWHIAGFGVPESARALESLTRFVRDRWA